LIEWIILSLAHLEETLIIYNLYKYVRKTTIP